jgi:hypothetical protein
LDEKYAAERAETEEASYRAFTKKEDLVNEIQGLNDALNADDGQMLLDELDMMLADA